MPVSAAAPLRGWELGLAVAAIFTAYSSVLYELHLRAQAAPATDAKSGYWGTLPSVWDHPEPNYIVSGAIGEFWSVLTTVPVAGTLLLYEGLRYSYGRKVLSIYVLTCSMYTLAFTAHLTLQPVVFSTTVISVMSNALLTFALFSHVAHKLLQRALVRWAVVLSAEALLVGTVLTLPYAISANGGVWTLFVVQSPGVFLATGISAVLASHAETAEERGTYRLVCISGSFLSSAMVLSLVECLIGFEHGILHNVWGFPWLHIAIHVFEQIGIYLFGVGVASLEALVLKPPRPGAELRSVMGFLPYLYCPRPLGATDASADCDASPLVEDAAPIVAEVASEAAAVHEVEEPAPVADPTPAADAASDGDSMSIASTTPLAGSGVAASVASSGRSGRPPSSGLPAKRSRVQSPGVAPLVRRPTPWPEDMQ